MDDATTYADKVIVVTGARKGIGQMLATHFLDGGGAVIGVSRGDGSINAPAVHPPQRRRRRRQGGPGLLHADRPIDREGRHRGEQRGRPDVHPRDAHAGRAGAEDMVRTKSSASSTCRAKRPSSCARPSGAGSSTSVRWRRRLEPIGDSMYAASKSAVITLTGVLAKELAGHGITVNTLAVTGFETDMLGAAATRQDRWRDRRPAPAALRHRARHHQRHRLLRVRPERLHHGADDLPRGRPRLSDLKAVHRVTNGAVAANTYFVPLSTPGECVAHRPGPRPRGHRERSCRCPPRPDRDLSDPRSLRPSRERRALPADLCDGAVPPSRRQAGGEDVELPDDGVRDARADRRSRRCSCRSDRASRGHATTTMSTTMHVPGHTPGSTILNVNGRLFTGDTIYRDEVWLMDLPEQDQALLADSVRGVWDLFPDGAQVYPGHGGSAAFADIKRSNRRSAHCSASMGSAPRDGPLDRDSRDRSGARVTRPDE